MKKLKAYKDLIVNASPKWRLFFAGVLFGIIAVISQLVVPKKVMTLLDNFSQGIDHPWYRLNKSAHISIVLRISGNFKNFGSRGYISCIIYQIICNTYSANGYSDNLL